MPTRSYNQNTLYIGQWNVICDVCGHKFKSADIKERWDGLRVCKEDWEARHPMDFQRGFKDHSSVPYSRPDASGTNSDGTPIEGTDVNGDTLPAALLITTLVLVGLIDGEAFSQQLETNIVPSGTPTWTITVGSLPSGLSIGVNTGIISGTLGSSADYSFTAKIVDGIGRTDTQAYSGSVVVSQGSPCTWEDPYANDTGTSVGGAWGPRHQGIGVMGDGNYINVGKNLSKTTSDVTDNTESWASITHQSISSQESANLAIMHDGNPGLIDGTAFHVYDYSLGTWSTKGSIGRSGLVRNTSCAIGTGQRYDFISYGGGWSGTADSNIVWGYKISTELWTALAVMPRKMIWGVAVYLGDGKVLVGGGSLLQSVAADRLKYYIHDIDLDTYTQTTSITVALQEPDPLIQFKMQNGKILVGSRGTNDSIASTKLAVYDPTDETWVAGCSILPSDTQVDTHSAYYTALGIVSIVSTDGAASGFKSTG